MLLPPWVQSPRLASLSPVALALLARLIPPRPRASRLTRISHLARLTVAVLSPLRLSFLDDVIP